MFVAIYPHTHSPALDQALLGAGMRTIAVSDAGDIADLEPEEGWVAAIVETGRDLAVELAVARRIHESGTAPVLVCAARSDVARVADAAYDDFVLAPVDAAELVARVMRLGHKVGGGAGEAIVFKDLVLDLATYQARLGDHPVDLTYMEYELLKFFVTHSGRVWSREQLLSRVWGYDYFGGSRTVDVHVRRLRAKLGEERASWITTVRSVGYRLG